MCDRVSLYRHKKNVNCKTFLIRNSFYRCFLLNFRKNERTHFTPLQTVMELLFVPKEHVNIVMIMIFYDNYNLCKEAHFIYIHKRKLQVFFKKFMNIKFPWEILLKENTGKAAVLERAGLFIMNYFPGILKFLSLSKHLRMAAYQKDKEKSSEWFPDICKALANE